MQRIVKLAAEQRPEILDYAIPANALKIDGPKQFVRIFDFYMAHGHNGTALSPHYLQTNKELHQELGPLGGTLYDKSRRLLRDEGGINAIVQLAAQQRPEILQHWRYRKTG